MSGPVSYYPPNQPGLFAPPPAMGMAPYPSPPVPADGLGVATSVLLGIMVLLSVVVALAAFNAFTMFDEAVDGRGSHSLEELVDADLNRAGFLLVFSLGELATGVVFICWQYRHSRNARSLAGPGGLGPAWAIAGWFIPFAYMVLPGIEVFQSSRASSPPAPGGGPRSGPGNDLVIPWAALFALGTALITYGLLTDPDHLLTRQDLTGSRNTALATALGALILAGAAILGAVMVQSLTKRQTRRIDQVYGGGVYVPWGIAAPAPWGAPAPWSVPAPWGASPAPPPSQNPVGPRAPNPWQPLE